MIWLQVKKTPLWAELNQEKCEKYWRELNTRTATWGSPYLRTGTLATGVCGPSHWTGPSYQCPVSVYFSVDQPKSGQVLILLESGGGAGGTLRRCLGYRGPSLRVSSSQRTGVKLLPSACLPLRKMEKEMGQRRNPLLTVSPTTDDYLRHKLFLSKNGI